VNSDDTGVGGDDGPDGETPDEILHGGYYGGACGCASANGNGAPAACSLAQSRRPLATSLPREGAWPEAAEAF
jgi:hypothetical protein